MKFINTRPTDRAQVLNDELALAGFDVIELPVLALEPITFSEHLQQQFQQLSHAQIIVVVSPTAVEVGMRYLKQANVLLSELEHVQWLAVGKKTALALAEYGIKSLVPEVETSEGMLSLPIFESTTHLKTIAFWRGEGGRQFMMQQCLAQNIEVMNFVLYQRYFPIETTQKFEKMMEVYSAHPEAYVSLVSSEASWKNWLDLCQNYPKFLENGHYFVLGDRLYQILNVFQKQTGLRFKISQIPDLKSDTILLQLKIESRRS